MKDMSKAQFSAALARHGMREQGFMGYVEIGIPGHQLSVSKLNAGENRRAQLAYLLRKRAENEAECACGHIYCDHHYFGKDKGYKCKTGCPCTHFEAA